MWVSLTLLEVLSISCTWSLDIELYCHTKMIIGPLKLVWADQKNLPKLVPLDYFCYYNWSGQANFGSQI